MRWLTAIPAAAALTLGTGYALCRFAFGSPRGDQNNDEAVVRNEQTDALRPKILAMIRSLNAVPCEKVSIESFDGLRLAGRYYHTADGAPLNICFHGWRGTPSRDFSGGAALCLESGHNLLMAEERAQCSSQGRWITMGVRERRDCLRWVEYAVERFGPDTRIILNGISMGAATVLMAAGLDLPANVKGIVADCPFTSPGAISRKVLRDMHVPVWLAYPFLALGARVFAGFGMEEADAAKAAAGTEIPILLIHGEDDRFVPCDMCREIAAAGPTVELETFPGAGHGLSFLIDEPRYRSLVEAFDRRVLGE